MKNIKSDFNNNKDKVVGTIKDKVEQITGNETLELKGKIQSTKADLNKEISKNNIGNKVNDIKEGIAEKINNTIDKTKDKK